MSNSVWIIKETPSGDHGGGWQPSKYESIGEFPTRDLAMQWLHDNGITNHIHGKYDDFWTQPFPHSWVRFHIKPSNPL